MIELNDAMSDVTESALEYGIKVVFEEKRGGVTMNCYVDDSGKFDEDCFYLGDENKVMLFEMKHGEMIGKGGIGYDTSGKAHPSQFKPTERYMTILPGIECEEDYVDEDDYNARFADAGEPEPIHLCISLNDYFHALLVGYKGEFWQLIHPDVNQYQLY